MTDHGSTNAASTSPTAARRLQGPPPERSVTLSADRQTYNILTSAKYAEQHRVRGRRRQYPNTIVRRNWEHMRSINSIHASPGIFSTLACPTTPTGRSLPQCGNCLWNSGRTPRPRSRTWFARSVCWKPPWIGPGLVSILRPAGTTGPRTL